MKSTADIEHELKQLRRSLLRLPAKNPPPGFTYGFDSFVVDDEYVELTGSIQGSVNHSLEIAFGSRATSDGSPIGFKSHGPDLLAVVDVLANAITGTHGENPILLKWIVDLQAAANYAFDNPDSSNPDVPPEKRERKPTEKRVYMEAEAELKAGAKKQRTEAKAKTAEARARTELSFTFDPSKLEPVPYPTRKSGRKTIPLLDQLTTYCRVTTDPTDTIRRWRCSGAGCPHSLADPRASERVLSHAMDCKFLSQELVAAASSASANRSLGAQLAALSLDPGKSSSRSQDSGEQPSVHSYFRQEGIKQRSLQHNHHALTNICVHSLPPTIVDSPYWKRMVLQLDPKIDIKSGSNLAHSLIPAEAARVRALSIKHLKQQSHLTLTCDGATSRRVQSIYTVHVTDPKTRQSHLLAGNEDSGKSHTGEHIFSVMLKCGANSFSAVTTDNAGNTRLAHELLNKKYPHIETFCDACHHMNNTAKDICSLPIFNDTITKIKDVTAFLRRSSAAKHHFDMSRVIAGITKGVVTTGNTRFLTVFHAADALIPNLLGIAKLIEDGVIKISDNDKLAWLKEPDDVRRMEDGLQLIRALLRPWARSVTCLESSASSPGDVCSFWLACLASLNDLFTDPVRCRRLKLKEDLISEIYALVNGRYEELFAGSGQNIYFATLFLDFRFLGSKVFRRKIANPLSTKIHVPARARTQGSSLAIDNPLTSHDTPDSDLRSSIPAYERIGSFLGGMLVHEINSGRAADTFDLYEDSGVIITEFRFQFMNYVRQVAPFDRYIHASTPLEYWTKLSRHADAAVLSCLALKLFSILPNSMPEERTVSSFTKLNSPDRAKQKVSTLVHMTQIRQHELRELNKDKPPPIGPTVRFRDLSDHVKRSAGSRPKAPAPGTDNLTTSEEDDIESGADDDDDQWELDAELDEVIERPPPGSRLRFELPGSVEIDLTDPMLLDLLSDCPVPGVPPQGVLSNVTPSRSSRPNPKVPLVAESFTF